LGGNDWMIRKKRLLLNQPELPCEYWVWVVNDPDILSYYGRNDGKPAKFGIQFEYAQKFHYSKAGSG
jgi:hypothetical protein